MQGTLYGAVQFNKKYNVEEKSLISKCKYCLSDPKKWDSVYVTLKPFGGVHTIWFVISSRAFSFPFFFGNL